MPFTERSDVQKFINRMSTEYNFSKDALYELFNQVQIQHRVIQHIRKPLEAEPWYHYRDRFLTPKRIEQGVQFWQQHAAALEKAEKIYGVPASIIVAILGVETNYGDSQGTFRVLDSLSTLGFEYTPRAAFFRSELENFLLLTREQHFKPLTIEGSYAGAMGQCQFMPSSYRKYAVDFSGHGKNSDLFHNASDAIGSIGNYLKAKGWQADELIVVPATKHSRFSSLQKSQKQAEPSLVSVSALKEHGFKPQRPLADDTKAVVLQLRDKKGMQYWFALHNFQVITLYNTSPLYAMAVYELGRAIYLQHEKLGKA